MLASGIVFLGVIHATKIVPYTQVPLEKPYSSEKKRSLNVRLREMWHGFRYGYPTEDGIVFPLATDQDTVSHKNSLFEFNWHGRHIVGLPVLNCFVGMKGPQNYLIKGSSLGLDTEWVELHEHMKLKQCVTRLTLAAFETGEKLAERVPLEYLHFEACPAEDLGTPCVLFWKSQDPNMATPDVKYEFHSNSFHPPENIVVRESPIGYTVQAPPHVRLYLGKAAPDEYEYGILMTEPQRFDERAYILVTSQAGKNLLIGRMLVLQVGERTASEWQATAVWSAVAGAISLAIVLIFLFGPRISLKVAAIFGVLAFLFIAVSTTSRLVANKATPQVQAE